MSCLELVNNSERKVNRSERKDERSNYAGMVEQEARESAQILKDRSKEQLPEGGLSPQPTQQRAKMNGYQGYQMIFCPKREDREERNLSSR